MKKALNFEPSDKLLSGLGKLYNAVKVTFGPKGHNVLIGYAHRPPLITKDGATVAESIELEDPTEQEAVKIARETATRTDQDAGDGTTQSTIEAYVMASEGLKALKAGANVYRVQQGMSEAEALVLSYLDKISIPVKTLERKIQVATISANNDRKLGEVIGSLIHKVGALAPISVEETTERGYEYEVEQGMWFDKGYVSPVMCTEAGKAVYEDPMIMVAECKIEFAHQVKPILEAAQGKSLVIIADDITGEALQLLQVMHKNSTIMAGGQVMQGKYSVLAVGAPAYAERRKEILQDIASYTGAVVVKQVVEGETMVFGGAKRVISTDTRTSIIGGAGDVKPRADFILSQMNKTDNEFDRAEFKDRLARLTTGVGILKIGVKTSLEMDNLKKRIEDAVRATQVAVEGGVVAGGGVALSNIELPDNPDPEINLGIGLVRTALTTPIKQLYANAGETYEPLPAGQGRNFLTGEVGEMVKLGVIDPTIVVKSALSNAISIAGEILTISVSNVQVPEKDLPVS